MKLQLHFYGFILFVYFFIASASFPQIRIKAVGDIMLGSVTPKTILPREQGMEFVNAVKNYLSEADIVFGNLEGAIIKDGMLPVKCKEKSRQAGRCYEFGMPEKISESLKGMGFNVLNMDNNHSEDYGENGYLFTQKKLEELKIKYSPKTGFAEFNIDGKTIVIAAFGYSGSSHNISDLNNTKTVIRELDNQFDIIIASFHGGAEGRDKVNIKNEAEFFLGENRGNVIAFAHTAIDAGADMVIGHGPHVLRAMEIYKNKLIAYSLGNFLTYGNMNISGVTGISVILDVDIDLNTGDFFRGKLIPIQQIGFGIPNFDETGTGSKLVQSLTNEDFPENEIIFTKNGGVYNKKIIPPPARPLQNYNSFKTRRIH